jgi:hypothetical protein
MILGIANTLINPISQKDPRQSTEDAFVRSINLVPYPKRIPELLAASHLLPPWAWPERQNAIHMRDDFIR